MWGMKWTPVSNRFATYNELVHHPLAGAETIKDVEEYDWPSADWLSAEGIKETIKKANEDERRAIVIATGEFFDIASGMRGQAQFMMDLMTNPKLAQCMIRHVLAVCRTATMRAVEEADGGIDIVWSGSDVGMQTGMLFAPEIWRELVKPLHYELIGPFKKLGLKTRYHCDGAIAAIIPDLIEMGLDLLDPIQPNLPGMDPENLRKLSGGRLAYYGGVDTQHLMPYGKPKEVEAKILELIEVLGENGGYVAAASNAVQADVPVENALALYLTARDYRY